MNGRDSGKGSRLDGILDALAGSKDTSKPPVVHLGPQATPIPEWLKALMLAAGAAPEHVSGGRAVYLPTSQMQVGVVPHGSEVIVALQTVAPVSADLFKVGSGRLRLAPPQQAGAMFVQGNGLAPIAFLVVLVPDEALNVDQWDRALGAVIHAEGGDDGTL